MAATFRHIQPAVGNKPQLDKSGDTMSSRTSDLRLDPLTVVNSDIISSLIDYHPLLATAPVFTPPASSPSANLAADMNINVLNTRINRQADAIKRAPKNGLHPVYVIGDGACLFRAVCLSDSGSEGNHLALRAAAVDYMSNNVEEYALYGSFDLDENIRFNHYLEKRSRPSQKVCEFVLGTLARLSVLNKCINLYFADCPPRCYFPMICSNADFVCLQHVNIMHYD